MATVWTWLGYAATVVTLFAAAWGAFEATMIRRERQAASQREQQDIRVFLRVDPTGEEIELPLQFKRRDFTRGELLGRLGMLPREQGKGFALRALSEPGFLTQINAISAGDSSALAIPVTQEELAQFAFPDRPSAS